MFAPEIEAVLDRDHRVRPYFKGVFPRDNLPRRVTERAVYVINTDTSEGPGEHWVAVYFDGFKKCVYFDSFGLPPLHNSIRRFISCNSVLCFRNDRMLQHPLSTTCGLYVIYFCRKVCRGWGLRALLRPFTPYNQEANDRRVRALVSR